MARTRASTPVIPVPQSRAEAADYLKRIGDHQRELGRIEGAMNDAIAELKTAAETEAAIPAARVVLLTDGLKTWCEANRAVLTNNDKVKSADLGTGTVSWRTQPAKVTLKSIDAVLAKLKELKLKGFIRTKEEVNKEAILASAGKVRARLATVPGLSIGSVGELFAVEPFEATLAATPAGDASAAGSEAA